MIIVISVMIGYFEHCCFLFSFCHLKVCSWEFWCSMIYISSELLQRRSQKFCSVVKQHQSLHTGKSISLCMSHFSYIVIMLLFPLTRVSTSKLCRYDGFWMYFIVLVCASDQQEPVPVKQHQNPWQAWNTLAYKSLKHCYHNPFMINQQCQSNYETTHCSYRVAAGHERGKFTRRAER
jgi:hypothetical protein